ncbi:NADH-quinone oxidoreductase subunit NuoK [Deinococcus radiodurans R1 = ATCC 13939 = DSM 20539]|uniref:NADH-quinone oxidoreductase subunit K n=2 Tax=Deinococcus radiodurans TaxID=1299 RepID=NUOK_DEIRA|nr:RecName: Full=NADH-quinone oxidoreductase subunit K; AltName: Full=NADH dehydrogenase I subunit K; AltName: Full=NDH-1 subunit K [Deinococcus radiodurans R1 = ATCC 13939 = DSM 20539]AAF11058.1 NADH dehydrogenase I, K subunit [Deinococcus radiodurans R1 = ATCC 13939 = DSM 20539]QEM70939.1 NADH-quinone oxidoreductase subunit NuoK [Deinococcus radiodurans]UDL00593.1 NADH-quinone oxidoreductase subunit NuoK [Deinococcus radiodurans R1 = ATCC 13939 = DSM 20539]HCE63543.1 NADH-quinone oxidoreducta
MPEMVPTSYYLALSGVLFALGLIGVMTRRTAILIFLSVELMLNAANIALVAFARSWGDLMGQTAVFIVMTLAAAEVAIGLAIIVAIFRGRETTNVDDLAQLRG